jgi:hypothetical protein
VLAREVRARADRPLLQRFAVVSAADDVYPTRWEYRPMWSDRVADDDEEFFTRQVSHGGSFLGVDSTPNLTRSTTPDLLVSDNGDLAIEATTDEPKTFFATTQQVKDANTALAAGNLRLHQTNRYLWVRHGDTSQPLFEVVPEVLSAKQRGLAVKTPQRCNEMAEFVTGRYGFETDATKQAHRIIAAVLTDVTGVNWSAGIKSGFRTHAAIQEYGHWLNDLVTEFQRAAGDPVEGLLVEAALTARLLNTALDPQLGAAISIVGVATDAQERNAKALGLDLFSYHFATVVAKSGTDFVTIENYARRDPRAQGTLSGGDPLYFFRMYGRGSLTDTFHARQLATGAFIGTTITLQVE